MVLLALLVSVSPCSGHRSSQAICRDCNYMCKSSPGYMTSLQERIWWCDFGFNKGFDPTSTLLCKHFFILEKYTSLHVTVYLQGICLAKSLFCSSFTEKAYFRSWCFVLCVGEVVGPACVSSALASARCNFVLLNLLWHDLCHLAWCSVRADSKPLPSSRSGL